MSEQENPDDLDVPYARKSGPIDPERREEAREVFLAELKKSDNVTQACAKAGISRETAYNWREQDQEFARLWQEAREEFNDAVRAAIYKRGVEGWQEPVVSMGKPVYEQGEDGKEKKLLTVTKYSDPLLLALAKSRMPEFREKQTIDLRHQLDQLADQAKDEFLASFGTPVVHENKEQTDS